MHINPRSLNVDFVLRTGEIREIEVNTSTTARQARRVLEQERRTGQVMSEGEQLFFAGHELPMDVVLSEAGVVDGSRVFVDPERFTVFVKLPNNKVHKLAVQMSDSVRILRARITDELGWPADKIGTLMHAGEPMADEKMLHDCAFETDGSGAITVLEPLQPGKNKWGSVNTSYLWGGSAMKVSCTHARTRVRTRAHTRRRR